MTNLYKNNKQDVSLFSDTSITTTDKYTSSILNSLLYNNSIQSGGLSLFNSKVAPTTEVTQAQINQIKQFMLTNPITKIDDITLILNNYILELNNIKKILNI